ncbi:MAG: hypothetical protein ABJE10_24495 [bacterium]
MRNNRTARNGTILFEVVVGLTILAIAGIGWVTLIAQTRASIAQMRSREVRMRSANDILERYRLYEPADLDARLGTTRIGALTISVSPLAPRLYSLVARDTGVQAILLSTTVYAQTAADSVQ